MEAWVSVIASLGFPIVACMALGFYVYKQLDNYRADIKEIQKEHKEEISKMTEALNNNTMTIQKLIDTLENNNKEK